MRRTVVTLGISALMLSATAGAALADTTPKYGTNAGDGLFGTSTVDKIYGLGGADLIYGYGGADFLYGGNEVGFGDKILGGNGNDRVAGQGGDDALYGGNGNDRVLGGYGGDLIVGGYGSDYLDSGPGSDQINAQDGQKDTIVIRETERDKVYYDKGLDEFLMYSTAAQSDAQSVSLSASKAEAEEVELSTAKPPSELFAHTGKVLVDHEGSEKCVSVKEVKAHVKHGDEIVNPAGCSNE